MPREHQCPYCNDTYENSLLFTNHLRESGHWQLLSEEERRDLQKKFLFCYDCGSRQSTKGNLTSHKKLHCWVRKAHVQFSEVVDEQPKSPCETIENTEKRNTTGVVYPYACNICDERFKTMQGMRRHRTLRHVNDNSSDDDSDDDEDYVQSSSRAISETQPAVVRKPMHTGGKRLSALTASAPTVQPVVHRLRKAETVLTFSSSTLAHDGVEQQAASTSCASTSPPQTQTYSEYEWYKCDHCSATVDNNRACACQTNVDGNHGAVDSLMTCERCRLEFATSKELANHQPSCVANTDEATSIRTYLQYDTDDGNCTQHVHAGYHYLTPDSLFDMLPDEEKDCGESEICSAEVTAVHSEPPSAPIAARKEPRPQAGVKQLERLMEPILITNNYPQLDLTPPSVQQPVLAIAQSLVSSEGTGQTSNFYVANNGTLVRMVFDSQLRQRTTSGNAEDESPLLDGRVLRPSSLVIRNGGVLLTYDIKL